MKNKCKILRKIFSSSSSSSRKSNSLITNLTKIKLSNQCGSRHPH